MDQTKKVKLAILTVLVGVLIVTVAVRFKDIQYNVMAAFDSLPERQVEKENGRTYIVDVAQERFDVTAALNNGFELKGFEFGIGKDTIAPIMKPEFAKPGDEKFEKWPGNEGVLGTVIDGQAKAYPLQLLRYHEVVNDTINEVPIAACYCPLANLGAIYKRETPKGEITIGTSGWTYNRTFMLHDHTTDSLWYPFETGLHSIGGELKGIELGLIESEMTRWDQWKEKHPDTWLCIGGETPKSTKEVEPENPPESASDSKNEGLPIGSGIMR